MARRAARGEGAARGQEAARGLWVLVAVQAGTRHRRRTRRAREPASNHHRRAPTANHDPHPDRKKKRGMSKVWCSGDAPDRVEILVAAPDPSSVKLCRTKGQCWRALKMQYRRDAAQMARWHGNAGPLVGTARWRRASHVSPSSRMTPVSARTPPGKDDALARDRRPPVGTAARSAAKGVYHAAVRMTLNAEVPAEGEPPPNAGSFPTARLRRAVPGPTGRTAQRSAFPCLRVALHGGVGAEPCTIQGTTLS